MKKKLNKNLLELLLVLAAVAVVAGLVRAGNLEPSAAPAPTMKTLDEIPPSWSQTLPADDGDPVGCGSSRFDCVMGGAAVLDKETGLVWEQSPENFDSEWSGARVVCVRLTTGGRNGWRLPSVHELASLVDPNNLGGGPRVPPGHPFIGVQSAGYWSATTTAVAFPEAWTVSFGDGLVTSDVKVSLAFVWCVLGDMNADQY